MTKGTLLLILYFFSLSNFSFADKPAYRLFTGNGVPANYSQIAETALNHDIVMFGELHNNPITHWLQLELTRDLHVKRKDHLMLGAEMFEADNQLLLDEYLEGTIAQRNFEAEAKLWNNYQTDYKPLVEFARENEIAFIATNIPRRYAALVHRHGFEALEELSPQAKGYIAPLPVPFDPDLPAYRAMLEMEGMPAHGSENFPKAQAIKDATMAHFIYDNFQRGGLFIHFNGAYHSNNREGIVWYLREKDEKLRIMTISTVEQDDVSELRETHHGLADFILVVPSTMTKTY